MTTIGFLHTAQVHVATFDLLVHQRAPHVRAEHLVDVGLLTRAREHGDTQALAEATASALSSLRQRGADVVVCTCSTLGPVAEAVGEAGDLPVLRVDRPMAGRAVELGPRIGVVAALASTLAPTRMLLEQEADRLARPVVVTERLVESAWEAFEAGDESTYLALVAEAARDLSSAVDVVVLAQASMRAAGDQLTDLRVRVLSSPVLAVDAAVTHVETTRPAPCR